MVESGKANILILCTSQEMGESFVKAAAPEGGDVTVGGMTAHLEVLAGDPRVNAGWEDHVKTAHGMLLLVRFMDVISMDKVKAIFRGIPTDQTRPLSIVLFREEGESDFKVSCAACGQKLWVRDQDIGKRGRCPNCKRAFRLPAQDEHLKAQLLVPDAVPVLTVDRGNEQTCQAAVGSLLERLEGKIAGGEGTFDPNVLKQTTMRIDVSTGDTTPGDTQSGG